MAHRKKLSEYGKHLRVDPFGNISTKIEHMTEKRYRKIKQWIETFLIEYKKPDSNRTMTLICLKEIDISDEELREIGINIALSRVLKDGEQPLGSAMCPAPLPKFQAYWNIGEIGSIWCDIELHNKRCFRVALYFRDKIFVVEQEF